MRTIGLVASLLLASVGCAGKSDLTRETFVAPGYRIVIPEKWGVGRTLPTLQLFPGFQRPDEEFNYRTYSITGASPVETIGMTLSWTADVVYAGKSDSAEQEFRRFIDDAVSVWEADGWSDITQAALPTLDSCCTGRIAIGRGSLPGVGEIRSIKIAVLRSDGLATAEIAGQDARLRAENVDALVDDLITVMMSAARAR